jgi:PAS domain S-box-containing protein
MYGDVVSLVAAQGLAVKNPFLDKLIERMDRVDPASLQSVVLKLSREKGFLETLFNTIQEGILVTDPEGRLRYLNAAAADMLGLDPATVIGDPLNRHLRDLDFDKLLSADKTEWNKVLAHELEVFYPRQRLLSFYIVPLADEETGIISGLAVILRDITETRRDTATAIESEKISALTLLAAGVAHEIGNPLNSLNIHLQLMERELKSLPAAKADRLRGDIRTAREEVTRLDRIIHQFLHAIRPTKPALARSSVNEIVTAALALLQRELDHRDILVEVELASDLPRCLVDRGQLQQACYNLIKNALQAMQSGGILRICTAADDQHVTITFTDTGHGIAADQIGRIFEPYYTTKETGSGLGLMIVQRIIREHGGTMAIESNAGRGTTVRLNLPLHEKRTRLLTAADKNSHS